MYTKAVIVLVAVFGLALVAPAASPLQISYVTSESMAPTLDTMDGYVLVPAGTVGAGDIITFYSTERASYVTHRAIRVTDAGIVTRGDANPSTDQQSGYPLVQQSQVAGRVLTVDGSPLVLPNLGTWLALIRTYWYALLALLPAYASVRTVGGSRPRASRPVLRSRDVMVTAAVVAVVVGAALVSLAAVHQTEVYTVTEQPVGGSDTLTLGEPHTESFVVRSTQTPLTHVVTETAGMRVLSSRPVDGTDPVAGGGPGWVPADLFESSARNVTVRVPAQGAVGPHATSLDLYPYPATLPAGVVERLHGVHPLAAALATVSVVVGPLYLCYWVLADTTAALRSSRRRTVGRGGGR